MKIIIVDNEKSALYSILDQIIDNKDIDYKLYMNNPLDAVEYCNLEVKGAFIDLKMPQISGQELAIKLIEKNPMIKIVFVTGYTIEEQSLKETFKENMLGILYKPLDTNLFKYYVEQISSSPMHPMIRIHMFGTFDVFVNDVLVEFNCDKSKEMLALLIVYRGRTLTKNKIIEHLWPEKEYNKADVLYRYSRWKLIDTLKSYNIFHLVNFSKAKINLNCLTEIICDYWEVLDHHISIEENDNKYKDDDIFLREYDWALEYLN
ncbi:MAG: response regulator [Anaeroplasma bactoclasticum]|nr:response regulator [Anaeroplasma bactoclasticum]MCM1557744.1 response regulator [Anaeroplasma bactoclasticum]